MKRNFKIFFCCVVFLLFIFISNFNSTMEIETDVQPKFGACLDKFGGTVEFVKGGNNNDYGGKVTVNADSDWRKGPVTATVHAYASTFDKIKKISIEIYNSHGYTCTDTDLLSLAGVTPGSYSDVKFKITFSGKDMWQNIKVWQTDTNDQTGSKGKDQIQIDVSKPEVKQFDISKDASNLTVNAKVRDHYSKLENKSVMVTVINSTTGYEEIFSNSKDAGDDSRSISVTVPLSTVGDGDIKVVLTAKDKVGNQLSDTRVLTSQVNEETGEVTETVVEQNPPEPAGGEGGSGGEGGALATGVTLIGENNYEFECDDEIIDLINEYWNYLLILGPVLMLVMCTIEFVKALMASDADAMKKATSNTIKRTIAFVMLMLLKVIMSVLFNIMGIQICW